MSSSEITISVEAHCIAYDEHGGLFAGLNNGNIEYYTPNAQPKGEGCSCKLSGHRYRVISLALFNSSEQQQQQLLASGSSNHTMRLWDLHTKECVAVLDGHTDFVTSLAFSPDSRLLASASYDQSVRLWDVMERQPAQVLQGHTDWVNSVSFSPDGQLLASGSWDGTVQLWSVPEGVPGPVLQYARHVNCVAFSPVVGSNMLASGCGDSIVRLWDVSGSKQLLKHELHGHSSWIPSVAFSPDGSQLVSGSGDRTVRLWSVASGKLLKILEGHSQAVNCVAFHPNGKQVASCSFDKTVRIWTVCEWSDRTHYLFGEEMKRLVFCLICIKEKFETNENFLVPQLPMALWLEIFSYLL
jgi:WD40 repeat protein